MSTEELKAHALLEYLFLDSAVYTGPVEAKPLYDLLADWNNTFITDMVKAGKPLEHDTGRKAKIHAVTKLLNHTPSTIKTGVELTCFYRAYNKNKTVVEVYDDDKKILYYEVGMVPVLDLEERIWDLIRHLYDRKTCRMILV